MQDRCEKPVRGTALHGLFCNRGPAFEERRDDMCATEKFFGLAMTGFSGTDQENGGVL